MYKNKNKLTIIFRCLFGVAIVSLCIFGIVRSPLLQNLDVNNNNNIISEMFNHSETVSNESTNINVDLCNQNMSEDSLISKDDYVNNLDDKVIYPVQINNDQTNKEQSNTDDKINHRAVICDDLGIVRNFQQNNLELEHFEAPMLYYKLENKTLHICSKGDLQKGWIEWDSSLPAPWCDPDNIQIKKAVIEDKVKPVSTVGWFGCMTTMIMGERTLSDIEEIENLDNLDMSNVINATCMFVGSDFLNTPKVSATWFDNIKCVKQACGICSYTKKFDNKFLNRMANALASTVEDISYGFSDNPNLTVFNTAEEAFNAKNTSCMFMRDSNLTAIYADKFLCTDKSAEIHVDGMFKKCSQLREIEIRKNTNWMEYSSISSKDLFLKCENLKGEQGTSYSSTCGLDFARIDEGGANPGLFSVHTYNDKNGYMVCVWNITQDAEHLKPGEIVFGPAIGLEADCLDVNESKSHTIGHCIATESWNEISEHINAGHADDFQECLTGACTHCVSLDDRDFFNKFNSLNVQCSCLNSFMYHMVLSEEDVFSYKKWNLENYSNAEGYSSDYSKSRIRATLNGWNNQWDSFHPDSTCAEDDNHKCLTSDNCLLSCFPKALQGLIKIREYTVPTQWSTDASQSYKITEWKTVKDKLWILNAIEAYNISQDYKECYDFGNSFKKIVDGMFSQNYTAFNESKYSNSYWLRCPYRDTKTNVAIIKNEAGVGQWNVKGQTGMSLPGVSPCFCL